MAWSNNNRAHHWTWKALAGTDLIRKTLSFDNAGTLTAKKLRHWVVGEGRTLRTKSDLLAAQMLTIFDLVGGKYESTWQSGKKKKQKARAAEKAISKFLQSGDKKVPELGDKVDEIYFFSN